MKIRINRVRAMARISARNGDSKFLV